MACKVSSRGIFGRIFHKDAQPTPVTAACIDLAQSLDVSGEPAMSSEHVRSCLHAVVTLLDAPDSTARERNVVIADLLDADLPVKILEALPKLEFEAAKDCMRLFTQILSAGTSVVFDYICCHTQILQMLLDGCGNVDVGLQSNVMLRSCTKHAKLVAMLLQTGFATGLMELAQQPNFDISSEAFCSLRELLMGCQPVAASYIRENFDMFFSAYHGLLQSDNYLSKRQALCLLADLLLEPDFKQVASAYASHHEFLKINMNLLRDSSKAIQFDAFRVFGVFVANPEASPHVHQILFKNKERLMKVLDSIGVESKEADETFEEDQRVVVDALQALPSPVVRQRTNSSTESVPSTDSSTEGAANERTSCENAVLNDYALNIIQWHSIF